MHSARFCVANTSAWRWSRRPKGARSSILATGPSAALFELRGLFSFERSGDGDHPQYGGRVGGAQSAGAGQLHPAGPVMLPADLPAAQRQASIDGTLVKREGSPANVAQAVLHFIDNDFVTGVCLPVDGGRTIYAAGESAKQVVADAA